MDESGIVGGQSRRRSAASGDVGRRSIVLLLCAGLATIAALAWWKLRVEVPTGVRALDVNNYDAYVYYYPTFDYAFRELTAGRFPFWNPHQHCGSPFFATGQHLLLYPLSFFYLLLPTAAAMQATAILHLALGLLFTALLGRVLGLAWPGAAVAAVAFVFAPPVASLVVVAHHLYGAMWMPLHLALTHLVLTRPARLGWATLLGASLAAQYLGGYPMFCLFSAYAIGGYVVWWAAFADDRARGADRWRAAAAVGLAAALAIALSAPQLLPAIELAKLSARGLHALTIEHADAQFGTLKPAAVLLDSLLPAWNSPFRFLNMAPSPGWIVLALAAAAPFNRRQRRVAAFFAALSLLTYLLGFGRHTPLYALYFHLPGADFFRVPVRFFALTALGIAVLAGIGTDGLWRARQRTRGVLIALSMAAGLGVVLYVAGDAIGAVGERFLPARWLDVGFAARLRIAEVYLAGIALWLAAYAMATGRRRAVLVAALPLCVYLSLGSSFRNMAVLPELAPDFLTLPDDAVHALRGMQGYDRTHVGAPRMGTAQQSPVKAGMLYGLWVDGDRENTYPRRFDDYAEQLMPTAMLAAQRQMIQRATGTDLLIHQGDLFVTSESPHLPLLDLMGTRFIVDDGARVFRRDDANERFPLRYQAGDLRIYENTAALPRAFLVQRAEVAETGAVLERMERLDTRSTAVLEDLPAIPLAAPSAAAADAGTARIAEYGAHRVVVDTDSSRSALLVLTDQYYPGWEATVDGSPSPIQRADYLFRAVALPAGAHRVEFRFVPRSFYWGCAIAVLAVVGLVGAARVRVSSS